MGTSARTSRSSVAGSVLIFRPCASPPPAVSKRHLRRRLARHRLRHRRRRRRGAARIRGPTAAGGRRHQLPQIPQVLQGGGLHEHPRGPGGEEEALHVLVRLSAWRNRRGGGSTLTKRCERGAITAQQRRCGFEVSIASERAARRRAGVRRTPHPLRMTTGGGGSPSAA